MSKSTSEPRWRKRLMYQPHPDKDTLFAGNPSNLVDATQNIEPILFDDLLEMRQVVWDLAAYIADWKPDLIPFFATGGIPYLIPVMHVLERQRQHIFIDGRHFHLFPGLTWDGTIEGKKSETFFASCFGEVLRTNVGSEPLKILVIDTTNSGNAVNNAVAACQRAFDVSGASPSSFALKIIGVVNSSHKAAQLPSPDKLVVTGLGRTAYVFTPSGYAPASTFVDRQFTSFSPLVSGAGCKVEVSYWLAGNIPTEDNAELIGVEAVHKSLSTTAEPIAGRLKIIYRNGEMQQGTGLGNLSSRLISLLSMPLDSMPWQKMQAISDLPPLTEEEGKALADLRDLSQGGLRLFELEPIRLFDRDAEDPSERVNGLLKIGRLLDDVEVYWLANQKPTPRVIAPKVRASLEQGKCSEKEALKYFNSAFPELSASDPGGDASAKWWDNQIRSLRKEAFADNTAAELINDESDCIDALVEPDDDFGSSDDLTLDFVVIVGGWEEARKQLTELKSKGMSLVDIEKHLNETWPVTADKAIKFISPTNEQVAMNFVLDCGGWQEASDCLEKWIEGNAQS